MTVDGSCKQSLKWSQSRTMIKLLAVVVAVVGLASAWPRPNPDAVCGYESCHPTKEGMLNVHLVPHSHDDVGWLKTVDQYFYGSHSNIQKAGVQYILDSVIVELLQDTNKRFIYVETAFFWKWWLEQSDETRDLVKQLVNNGQLEFIGGSWSMEDEATTHYHSNIDQYTWGLRKLNDTFGACGRPKVGWQIDPFGHSRETASMFARFGFDGMFLGRIDYQDKDHRFDTRTMEMIWEGSESLGEEVNILTSALDNEQDPGYNSPSRFCFDVNCNDEPIIDNNQSFDFNVKQRVEDFLTFVKRQASRYATNHIIVPMGGDFNYMYAHYNFKNMDKLIKYVNDRQSSGSDVNLLYSTPSCYLKSINEANVTWTTKSDDFFPYASDPHAYWTGYFTSRPTLKYFERKGNNFLQVCKQLQVLGTSTGDASESLDPLREAMGVMQHHDAITGTEKQHVAEDYARLLDRAFDVCEEASSTQLNNLVSKSSSNTELKFEHCLLRNISECAVTSGDNNFVLTVYNPLSRTVNHYVRVPVSGSSYVVRDGSGQEIKSQIVPIPEGVSTIPGRTSKTTNELVFRASQLPPVGFRSYYISQESNRKSDKKRRSKQVKADIVIGDETVSVAIDSTSGLVKSITTSGKETPITQNLFFYEGQPGDNHNFDSRASGAYVFRPATGTQALPISVAAQTTVHRGDIVDEVHQTFTSWASQVVRHYKGESHVEFEWLVGPIPVDDDVGKEVITRYSTNIASNGTFYTDSNGRELVLRRRSYRPTWDYQEFEPISGNYYPVTTKISLHDDDGSGLTVLTDRAQGGTSMNDGELELMVHRRLLHDDAFGVGEALNETAFGEGLVARGHHWVLAGDVSSTTSKRNSRYLNQQKVLDSWTFVTDATNLDFDTWSQNYRTEFSGIKASLPDNVQILTLEPWKGQVLFRLEHILSVDDVNSTETVTVNLQDVFSSFKVVYANETNLAANQWIDDVSRLKWSKESNEVHLKSETAKFVPLADFQVTLRPMEIRTFVLLLTPTNKKI